MKDLKYLSALSIPISAALGISLGGYWCFLTPIYAFVLIPIMEILLPVDPVNDDPESKSRKKVDRLFDWMLYANVPLVYGLLCYFLWSVTRSEYSDIELIGLVLSLGIVLGTNGINVGHELGHRQESWERYLGKFLLLPSLYMHFFIEHNFGHHVHAATPEDPATARYNQSVYSFWVTSVSRQYINAWRIQKQLLRKGGSGFLSVKNDMFWFQIIQALYLTVVYLAFGPLGLAFAMASAVVGFLLLETVNYIEHYGLIRKRKESGRYERVREVHSWNSNHVMGRIILYELTRHSDHHYISSKKYQLLDCHQDSPQMPFGYPTSMVLSFIPPLWFGLMNPLIPESMKPSYPDR